jgi:hypothetical protein
MQHGQVHAACPSPCQCYMSMSMLHVHVHAAWPCPCPCCLSMSMLNAHVYTTCLCHDAYPSPSLCPCPCRMSMFMLHIHVHTARVVLYMYVEVLCEHGHRTQTWTILYCMFMSVLHVPLNAASSYSCFIPVSMLHAYVHTEYARPCCMSKSIFSSPSSTDLDILRGFGDAT